MYFVELSSNSKVTLAVSAMPTLGLLKSAVSEALSCAEMELSNEPVEHRRRSLRNDVAAIKEAVELLNATKRTDAFMFGDRIVEYVVVAGVKIGTIVVTQMKTIAGCSYDIQPKRDR